MHANLCQSRASVDHNSFFIGHCPALSLFMGMGNLEKVTFNSFYCSTCQSLFFQMYKDLQLSLENLDAKEKEKRGS